MGVGHRPNCVKLNAEPSPHNSSPRATALRSSKSRGQRYSSTCYEYHPSTLLSCLCQAAGLKARHFVLAINSYRDGKSTASETL